VIRIRTASGLPITCALTICASESVRPYITLQGSAGTAAFHYTKDRLTVETAAARSEETYGRDHLTENLLAHRAHGAPLISSLVDSGVFMLVLEAVRTAPLPAPIEELLKHAAAQALRVQGTWCSRGGRRPNRLTTHRSRITPRVTSSHLENLEQRLLERGAGACRDVAGARGLGPGLACGSTNSV
jgi:hypothetical protein